MLFRSTEPSPSRALVAEAMILAGAVTAEFGVERGLALPFRSQLPADLPPAAELNALPDGAVRYAAIKRCLSRGLMGTSPAANNIVPQTFNIARIVKTPSSAV